MKNKSGPISQIMYNRLPRTPHNSVSNSIFHRSIDVIFAIVKIMRKINIR